MCVYIYIYICLGFFFCYSLTDLEGNKIRFFKWWICVKVRFLFSSFVDGGVSGEGFTRLQDPGIVSDGVKK